MGGILLYRATLGRFLGGQCRFHPTCSQYGLDAIRKYGALKGLTRTIGRICRCHPLSRGGYDPA
ncbi:MAG: membrane protein insertion efficiency factor YidD [Tepidisphaerales bacterium]